MRRLLTSLALFGLAAMIDPPVGWSADDPKVAKSAPAKIATSPASASAPSTSPSFNGDEEAKAMTLVRDHLPELAEVLGPLKATNPPEYRKAMAELAIEARTLHEIQAKNPARFGLALDAWKARTRVELIAAQLAKAPSPERESQLRSAIEARVDADLRRHRFELDQAEASVNKIRQNLSKAEATRDRARATLDRAEKNREAKVDARFQALQSKIKPATKPQPKTKSGPATLPPPPTPNVSVNGVPMLKPNAPAQGN